MNDSRPARLNIAPVLHINRVHLSKVIHVRQEDVDLNHLGNIGSSLLEDMGQVLDTLVLEWERRLLASQLSHSGQLELERDVSYSVGLDIAINQLASGSVHGDSAGAVDDAIGDDCLGVDAGERLGGLIGEDGGLGGHFGYV